MGLRGFVRLAWDTVEGARGYKSNWHIDVICEHLEAVSKGEIRRLLINMPPRHMKLVADSTPIATPSGYRAHGDLRVGDYVFGPDGLPTVVVLVTEKAMADFEVSFSTGETIKVNGGHLWTVWDRWSQGWKTMTTEALAAAAGECGRNRFFIPDEAPLHFDAGPPLPLHPYFMGCWLGDGTSTKPAITHDQDDAGHIEKLARLGFTPSAVHRQGRTLRSEFWRAGIEAALRDLGVHGAKHIPEIYATASEADRMELLAGLIDTDGHVEPTGRVRISTCAPHLAQQIERLVLSLGFRAYTVSAPAPGYGDYASDKTVYQIGFQATRDIPTAIPRKRIARTSPAHRRRAIVGVVRSTAPEQGHCITVGRPDGLYVVGRTNLVTHNSLCCSVFWPVYDWLHDPWRQFLYVSYAHNLSIRDSVKTRRVIESSWFQGVFGEKFRLTSDQNTKVRFDNDQGGYRLCTSVGGQLTGDGGDHIVVDDPNNVRKAESAAIRESTNDWWDEAMQSRHNDPDTGTFVVIQQRTHDRDLTGHILEKEARDQAEGWVHLCLPARYDPQHKYLFPGDPRKTPGEPLFKDRFGDAQLRKLELALKTYAAAAQLQQVPTPREGGTFKRAWFKIIDRLPDDIIETVRAWDLAGTDKIAKTDPDWTRGLRMSLTRGGDIIIENVRSTQSSFGQVEDLILETARGDGPMVRIRVPQDPGQAGKSQAAYLIRKLSGFRVFAEVETGKKEHRADPLSAQAEAGNVYLLKGAWNYDFLEEAVSFPNGAHDDQIDAASAGFRALMEKNTGMISYLQALAEAERQDKEPPPAGTVVTPADSPWHNHNATRG